MRILLDMDGPLADFETGLYETLKVTQPEWNLIHPEDRVGFKAVHQYPPDYAEGIQHAHCSPGFFLNLPPTQGCKAGVTALKKAGHDLWICTSPLVNYQNCVGEKYQWVEREFGAEMVERIILTRDKTLIRGDFLIDDYPETTGVETPTWKQLLFKMPKNSAHHTETSVDWNDIDHILRLVAG